MRYISIGAHPDDCEIGFGGTAARLAAEGHAVKFLSVTNGRAGHHVHAPEVVIAIRRQETLEAARRLGIAETEILDHADGELTASLVIRNEIIQRIRSWRADVVLTHRPWDYHADHRYTSQAVQDAAYLVMVPHLCAEAAALRRNPVFLYLEDAFRLPAPFLPEIAVDLGAAWEQKIDALDAHQSQFYEWLPWIAGDEVPEGAEQRRLWLARKFTRPLASCVSTALERRYGRGGIAHAEAFQVCEYGRQPSAEELDEMLPR